MRRSSRARATSRHPRRTPPPTTATTTPSPPTRQPESRPWMKATSRPLRCPSTISRPIPTPTISGRPVTGPGGLTGTTGFPACGARRPTMARSGPRPTGAGTAATIASITVTGDPTSASTEALTTASATSALATSAATGAGMTSTTTDRSTTWATSTNVYNRDVIYNNVHYSARPSNRISYNGGNGGVNVAPRPTELAAMHETHARPIAAQTQVRQQAAGDRQQLYNQNHGRPAQAALARPAGESGPAHIAEPPAAVQQVQQRDAALQQHNVPVEKRPGAPAENRPGVPAGVHPTPIGESRPVAPAANIHPQEGQRTQPLTRPGAANHPEAPPSRPATGNPAAPQSRPEPALRPAPDSRPMQPSRPEPVMRPDPVNRPQYTPPSRPMPQSRPEPSAPIARPEAAPRPEPQPRPEAIQRPEPAPRAAPAAVPRPSPAPALRAAPAPAARPAPEAGHEDRPH